ncbi:MAG: hypothetical protein U0T84_13285 [Chitinophagales bacterium]
MVKNILSIFLSLTFTCSAFSQTESRHLSNIRQLTFGGDNAEAYFSKDGKFLTCQITNPAWRVACDQIYKIEIAKALADTNYRPELVSTGKGRTTCSYFLPDGKKILYASTHLANEKCPPPVPHGPKYLWAVYPGFDIFVADQKGRITKQITHSPLYDAEGTVAPNGKKMVFTSMRSGDLELYTMDLDGKHVQQITNELGYDGGAFFSPDSKKLVFRASRPATDSARKEYRELLQQSLVAPPEMEIFTVNADGTNLKQVTHLGKANWAPFYLPDGEHIIFSSNHRAARGYDFQLYVIKEDGTGLEQITTESNFNAFPMFSPDGKYLVFSSNRNNHGTHDTNIFIAEWK